jgi:hypothetical protein
VGHTLPGLRTYFLTLKGKIKQLYIFKSNTTSILALLLLAQWEKLENNIEKRMEGI